MNGILFCFSSELELGAAFPDGVPDGAAIATTGVGLVDAAIGTTRLVHALQPERIVFLGTCGAHAGSALQVGDIANATVIRLGSGDIVRGDMRIPSLLPAEVRCDAPFGEALGARLGRHGVRVVPAAVSCTLGVTESDQLAEALARHDGSQVENLEAFSVVHAAGTIPTTVLLAVTNLVGSGGGREWFANFRGSMRMLAHCVEAYRIEGAL